MPYSGNDLKDLSLFVILFSVVMLTLLSSYFSNKVSIEHNFNAQAQVIDNGPQSQQPSVPPLTTQTQTGTMPTIKITSHSSGQQVEVGPLTIAGTSSDTPSIDCDVYADWNDNKPFGKAVAAGPGGTDDYSKWTFTYNSGYHMIQNGTNNLTSKISCVEGPTNLTKWSSVNLIGVNGSDSDSTINQAITTGLPPPPSPIGLPLPTPNQAGVTSSSLDPVVGEANEEDEESNEDDDDDFDDSNVENEDDSDEEDEEDNNGSGGEDSGDNENGSGSADGDDGDDGDEDNDLIDFGPDGPVDFDADDFMD